MAEDCKRSRRITNDLKETLEMLGKWREELLNLKKNYFLGLFCTLWNYFNLSANIVDDSKSAVPILFFYFVWTRLILGRLFYWLCEYQKKIKLKKTCGYIFSVFYETSFACWKSLLYLIQRCWLYQCDASNNWDEMV